MFGNVPELGLRAGFLSGGTPPIAPGPSIPIITRGVPEQEPAGVRRAGGKGYRRAALTGDIAQILFHLGMEQRDFQRAITSGMAAFPARENLEAEAKLLIPLDTPLRNLLPRTPGAGTASKWKQLSSLGGGYMGATTVAAGGFTAPGLTLNVNSVAGFVVGDTLLVDTGANQEQRIIASTNPGAVPPTVTMTSSLTISHAAGAAVVKAGVQPGSGAGAIRAFFAETGAPAEHSSVYVDQSAGYRLLGTFGQVSGFAMAAGATFQAQLAVEKANAIRNLMLNEENALINGDATSAQPPWGDGTNALAFSGLVNLISTANGTPSNQVQLAVGALTTQHLDQQLSRLYNQGAQGAFLLMNEQEIRSLVHLGESSGSVIRVMATSDGKAVLGLQITGYVHPITGEMVSLYASRFLSPGTILFGSQRLPDGSPTMDVNVLPQVQLPQLAPYDGVQGYTAQEIAPSIAAPQMYPFLVTVYEVLRLKSALHAAKSAGVTAV